MAIKTLLGTVCAFLLCIAVSPLWASTIYSYTGNSFNTFNNSSGAPPSYDITMNITLTMEYAVPLMPNLSQQPSNPISFSISDGINIIDNTNWTSGQFRVGTDSSGNINSWLIYATASPGSGTSWYIETIGSFWDFGRITTNAGQDTANIRGTPGSWSIVPVPAALWLFGSGLISLLGFGFARCKKA